MTWGNDIDPFDWSLTLKVISVFIVGMVLMFLLAGCTTYYSSYHDRCYPGNMACMTAEEIIKELNSEIL